MPDKEIFPEQPIIIPCTWNECTKGHRWAPAVAVAKCEGCQSPVIAVRMENCPWCNEPNSKISLRSDYVPRGGGIGQRCKGAKVHGESVDVELIRHQWMEVEGNGMPKEDVTRTNPPILPRVGASDCIGSALEGS
jgi:hypothetical protein